MTWRYNQGKCQPEPKWEDMTDPSREPDAGVEQERCSFVNTKLNQAGFEMAWEVYQNTLIDLVADSDDQTCRCVHNAIAAYLNATAACPSPAATVNETYRETVRRVAQAREKRLAEVTEDNARLRAELDLSQKAVDVLESNARQQAKLLADTGRELDQARGMVEWHDISTIPKDGTSVLVSMRGDVDGPYWVVFWNGKHFENVESGGNISDSANIWMRIPRSPPFTSTDRRA